MRGCHQTTRPLQLGLLHYRTLQSSTWPRPRKPAVSQFSNDELLNLINEVEEVVQLGNTSSETQYNGSQSQQPILPFLELPESPLISPRLLDARARHREEKPLPSKERTAFQLMLDKNPFGI